MNPGRVLVVGHGFLGTAIAAAAIAAGFETWVLTRSKPARTGPWCTLIGDASDLEIVLRASSDIDHIIYAAGMSVPGAAEMDPVSDLAEALSPLLNVLDVCRRVGCGLTLLSSGGTVYGKPETLPIPEHHPTNPLSCYGIRTLAGEKHALMWAARFGFTLRILRVGNAFGVFQPLRRSQGIVATLLHSLANDKTMTVYGDGLVVRDYIHVDDVASAALQLLKAPPLPTVVNVGTGIGSSILDLIAICSSVTGKRAQILFDRSRTFDVATNVLDISRLRHLIDFSPAPAEAAIRQVWNQMAVVHADLLRG